MRLKKEQQKLKTSSVVELPGITRQITGETDHYEEPRITYTNADSRTHTHTHTHTHTPSSFWAKKKSTVEIQHYGVLNRIRLNKSFAHGVGDYQSPNLPAAQGIKPYK